MKLLNPKRLLFYTFIIGSLYLIQLSSHSEFLSNYTSLFWIIFMFICFGLYWLRKDKMNKKNEEDS